MINLKRLQYYIRHPKKLFHSDPDSFLKKALGVIHIGANEGQERDIYERYSKRVIWVEPIPSVFKVLQENISEKKNQIAYQALISKYDTKEVTFNIANMNAASSSMLEMSNGHKEAFPDIEMIKQIKIVSVSLKRFLDTNAINYQQYNSLVLDTQGTELDILKKAASDDIMKFFKFIKVEVTDFKAYEGSCDLSEMEDFMRTQEYLKIHQEKYKNKSSGCYYDIVYRKS